MTRRLTSRALVAALLLSATAHTAAAFDWSAEVYGGVSLPREDTLAASTEGPVD